MDATLQHQANRGCSDAGKRAGDWNHFIRAAQSLRSGSSARKVFPSLLADLLAGDAWKDLRDPDGLPIPGAAAGLRQLIEAAPPGGMGCSIGDARSLLAEAPSEVRRAFEAALGPDGIPATRMVPFDDIAFDSETQPRASVDMDRIAEYAESMAGGASFPPVVLFFDGEHFWIGDGFHRVFARRESGHADIEAEIRPGGKRDAILYAVGANATHGSPRTNDDKRRSVAKLLDDPEWSAWSDSEIARRCNVSHTFVAKMRPAGGATCNASGRPRKTRAGRTIDTANIGRKPEVAPATRGKIVPASAPADEPGPTAEVRAVPASPAIMPTPPVEFAPGEVSAHRAMIDAGLEPESFTIAADPKVIARRVRRRLSPEQVAELVAELTAGEPAPPEALGIKDYKPPDPKWLGFQVNNHELCRDLGRILMNFQTEARLMPSLLLRVIEGHAWRDRLWEGGMIRFEAHQFREYVEGPYPDGLNTPADEMRRILGPPSNPARAAFDHAMALSDSLKP